MIHDSHLLIELEIGRKIILCIELDGEKMLMVLAGGNIFGSAFCAFEYVCG